MVNVIISEIYKIFRSKVFYVISILLFIMNVFDCGMTIYKGPGGNEVINGLSMYQASYRQDLIFYVILTFICCLITSEYLNGSIKQIASHGIKRWKIVIGRFISMSLVITLIWIIVGVINLLVVSMKYGLGSANLSSIIYMNIGLFCMIIGVSGVGTLISYLFKNSAISIGISFLFVMSKNLISSLLTSVTKNDVFMNFSISNMRNIITNLSSNSGDVLKCSIVFLSLGIISIVMSSILFSIRDIN